MKKTDIAYIAGIVDGEGCIYLESKKNKNSRATQLSVSVGSTDKWLCEMLKFSFGGCVYDMKSKTMQCWKWEIRCRQASAFLEVVYPYLKLKKPQAEICIQFQKARHVNNWQHKTEEEKAIEEAQIILVKSLKRNKQ